MLKKQHGNMHQCTFAAVSSFWYLVVVVEINLVRLGSLLA